jgi:DNA-binding response OmpR family regulator
VDTSNGFGTRDVPLVLCVGTTADDFAAVLAATGGRLPVLYLPDVTALREVLPGEPARPRLIEYGKLRLDPGLREATWHGAPIRLSARDFDLLFTLADEAGRVRTFAELTQQVWGRTHIGDTEAVVSAVKRLRQQLRAAAAGVHVVSVRGVGYRLVVDDEPGQDPER